MALQKKGLGMGLGALMSSNDLEAAGNKIHEIDINKINPNKNQPRTYFNDDALQELADSISEIGIIQPLIVKKNGEFYESHKSCGTLFLWFCRRRAGAAGAVSGDRDRGIRRTF